MELTNQTLEQYTEQTQSTKATDRQQPANSSADDANNVFDIPQCRQSSSIFISNPMGTSTNSSSKSTSKKSSKTSKSSSPGGSNQSTPSTTNDNVGEEIHSVDPTDVDSAPTSSSSSITHYIRKGLNIPSEMTTVVDMTGKKR